MFRPRLALASLSGESNARWAIRRSPFIGAAFLGAFNLDDRVREASRSMVRRGRDEFLTDEPFLFLREQLRQCRNAPFVPGVNVRASTPEPIHKAGKIALQNDAILEINAHCRQPEMESIGCGQGLLRDPDRLRDCIQAGRDSGAILSVKGRFEVEDVDCVEVLNRAAEWGADILHVDAMDSEPMLSCLRGAFLIANNGVRGKSEVQEYCDYGADAVSVGRGHHPSVLKEVQEAVDQRLPTPGQNLQESEAFHPRRNGSVIASVLNQEDR